MTTKSPEQIIEEFNDAHKFYISEAQDCLFVEKLRKSGLSNEHIAAVLEAMDNTCQDCWDQDYGCTCWNENT